MGHIYNDLTELQAEVNDRLNKKEPTEEEIMKWLQYRQVKDLRIIKNSIFVLAAISLLILAAQFI